MRYTIAQLSQMRESEEHVEFKKGEKGNVSYNGAGKDQPKDRRRCILGYVTALCNEGGGRLVIGMHDDFPHRVVGTDQCVNGLGQLESDIYRDAGIRPDIYELYKNETEKTGRVLVIEVPPHPVGKVYKFEDVALMRVGEELRPMDDKTYISIIQEQEPDFSEQFCENVCLDDLDPDAIRILKAKYAKKQNNPSFEALSDYQALSDLKLVSGDKVTNAALLLAGKEEVISRLFPQAKVMLEYRNAEGQIQFDNRMIFGQPFFILIDKLWNAVNLRNGAIPVRDGSYIFDIPYFNEDVIREVINNAFAHRDYRRNSEIVIKQYPAKLEIINAGGFPLGVNLDNLLTVPSTPRNRLLTDVLSKTGIVERSGQGIDKVFFYTLSEGKPVPDYSHSDDFMVSVALSASVKDTAFAIFVQGVQQDLPDSEKLSVFDILALCEVRDGAKKPKSRDAMIRLEKLGCLEKHGNTRAAYVSLPRRYYELSGNLAAYSLMTDWDLNQVWAVLYPFLRKYKKAKKSDMNKLIGEHISDKQLRNIVKQLKDMGWLRSEGVKSQTTYYVGDTYNEGDAVTNNMIEALHNESAHE